MEALSIAFQIYGVGIIISFLIAVLIKVILFVIRYFSRETIEKTSDAH